MLRCRAQVRRSCIVAHRCDSSPSELWRQEITTPWYSQSQINYVLMMVSARGMALGVPTSMCAHTNAHSFDIGPCLRPKPLRDDNSHGVGRADQSSTNRVFGVEGGPSSAHEPPVSNHEVKIPAASNSRPLCSSPAQHCSHCSEVLAPLPLPLLGNRYASPRQALCHTVLVLLAGCCEGPLARRYDVRFRRDLVPVTGARGTPRTQTVPSCSPTTVTRYHFPTCKYPRSL